MSASSLPFSVGAQILLHYLSSSADNSYSPRYVRSALSLTSDLMLFNMAHSLSGLEWTLAAQYHLSLSLFVRLSCWCILSHSHSCALLYGTQARTTHSGPSFFSSVSSNPRGSRFDLQYQRSCSATETARNMPALTNFIISTTKLSCGH